MADESKTGLTLVGKLVVGLFVAGLVAGGVVLMKRSGGGVLSNVAVKVDSKQAATPPEPAPAPEKAGAEAPDSSGITTVKDYAYVPAERLPPVKGVSNYVFKDNTVVFPINMWIGWLPIVAANDGFKPNENSVFFKKYGFKVELKLIDDPVAARDAYVA